MKTFKVPENYFETLAERSINAYNANKRAKRIRLQSIYIAASSAAAVFVVWLGFNIYGQQGERYDEVLSLQIQRQIMMEREMAMEQFVINRYLEENYSTQYLANL